MRRCGCGVVCADTAVLFFHLLWAPFLTSFHALPASYVFFFVLTHLPVARSTCSVFLYSLLLSLPPPFFFKLCMSSLFATPFTTTTSSTTASITAYASNSVIRVLSFLLSLGTVRRFAGDLDALSLFPSLSLFLVCILLAYSNKLVFLHISTDIYIYIYISRCCGWPVTQLYRWLSYFFTQWLTCAVQSSLRRQRR